MTCLSETGTRLLKSVWCKMQAGRSEKTHQKPRKRASKPPPAWLRGSLSLGFMAATLLFNPLLHLQRGQEGEDAALAHEDFSPARRLLAMPGFRRLASKTRPFYLWRRRLLGAADRRISSIAPAMGTRRPSSPNGRRSSPTGGCGAKATAPIVALRHITRTDNACGRLSSPSTCNPAPRETPHNRPGRS